MWQPVSYRRPRNRSYHLGQLLEFRRGSRKQIIDKTSKDSRRVYVLYSDNDGKSWSTPKEITSSVKHPDWTWYATGPCHGIQLQGKKNKGRLVVAANHMVAGTKTYHSQLIYSDDKGETWKLGGIVNEHGGNESSVVELKNGYLMLNMRNYNREESKTRSYAISKDGGETVSQMSYLPELIEPICQGSTLNYMKRERSATTFYSPIQPPRIKEKR